jgi:ribosome-associated toxin RatA of RatAB toxin-antitoxin module
MSVVNRSAVAPYTPAQMYSLVEDVPSYPQFLPWCRSATISPVGPDEVRATIELAFHGVHRAFTTANRMQKDKMIEIRLVEGPFRRLKGFWRFDALGDKGCKISLDMEYEFSNKLLVLAVGPVFSQIANSLVDAFYRRATQVYGKG